MTVLDQIQEALQKLQPTDLPDRLVCNPDSIHLLGPIVNTGIAVSVNGLCKHDKGVFFKGTQLWGIWRFDEGRVYRINSSNIANTMNTSYGQGAAT